jgi:hypothetical protein
MTSERRDLEAENAALREELAGFRRSRMAWPLVPPEFDQPTRSELGQIFEAALRRGPLRYYSLQRLAFSSNGKEAIHEHVSKSFWAPG